MKKTILKNVSLAFCISLLSAQISAQVIADPGSDPLTDSSQTMESLAAHYGKATAFKSGIINEGTYHYNFSLNKTFVFVGERVEVQKRKKCNKK